MNYNISKYVNIGNEGINKFEDKCQGKIRQIIINSDRNGIYGIGFQYQIDQGEIQSKHNLAQNWFTKMFQNELVFTIPENDYLLMIKGNISEKGINRLEFHTYLGNNRNFGGVEGEPFEFFYPGMSFTQAHGSFTTQGQLKSLGFILQQVSDWEQQQMRDVYITNAEKVKIPF